MSDDQEEVKPRKSLRPKGPTIRMAERDIPEEVKAQGETAARAYELLRQRSQRQPTPQRRPDGVIEVPMPDRPISEDRAQRMARVKARQAKERAWRERETKKVIGVTCPTSGPLVDYLWAYSPATGAAPSWHLHCGLALLSSLAHSLGFSPPREGPRTFAVSTMAIGDSGSAKSTVINDLRGFHDHLTYALGPEGSALPRPIEFSGTYPGIFEAIAEAVVGGTDRRAVILCQDEYTTLFSNTKYGWDSQSVCKIADGSPLERHLRSVKTQGNKDNLVERIERFSAPIVFATTYDTHAHLIRKQGATMVLGGMASRFLWEGSTESMSTLIKHVDHDEFDTALDSWVSWFQWANAMRTAHCDGNADQIRLVYSLDLHDFAAERLQPRCDSPQTPSHLKQMWKRALANVPMYAALYALQSKRLEVIEEDVEYAIALLCRSVDHYDTIYQRTGGDDVLAPNPTAALTDRLLRILQSAKDKGTRRAELYALLNRPKKRDLDEAIELLADSDKIVEITTPPIPGKRGRPPTTLYAIEHSPDADARRGVMHVLQGGLVAPKPKPAARKKRLQPLEPTLVERYLHEGYGYPYSSWELDADVPEFTFAHEGES